MNIHYTVEKASIIKILFREWNYLEPSECLSSSISQNLFIGNRFIDPVSKNWKLREDEYIEMYLHKCIDSRSWQVEVTSTYILIKCGDRDFEWDCYVSNNRATLVQLLQAYLSTLFQLKIRGESVNIDIQSTSLL